MLRFTMNTIASFTIIVFMQCFLTFNSTMFNTITYCNATDVLKRNDVYCIGTLERFINYVISC